MPGVYGYFNEQAGDTGLLSRMQHAMSGPSHLTADAPFSDGVIHASRIHLDVVGERQTPYSADGYYVWVEGEVYNKDEVLHRLGLNHIHTFAEALAACTSKNCLTELLKEIDGYFCAVIYDSNKKLVHCISDRHGLRPLFFYHKDGAFAWSGEVKGLLALDFVDRTLSPKSIECFLEHGFYKKNETAFQHIELVAPASVLTFNLTSKAIESDFYWSWSEISGVELSLEEAAKELGNIFQRSVERRLTGAKVGVALSGGLDSRAIVAAAYKSAPDKKRYAYTFGTPNCRDHRIAADVARVCDWDHEFFQFTTANWFEPRIEKVWQTDGLKDLQHMHGGEFQTLVRRKIDINLNGYIGDVIIGGTYLWQLKFMSKRAPGFADLKVLVDDILSDPAWTEYLNGSAEAALIALRGRRLINMGVVNQLSTVEQRLPFMDNELIEFVFGLPQHYRNDNRLYTKMLLHSYPELFNEIPWAHTGKRVSPTRDSSFIARGVSKVGRIVASRFGRIDDRAYTDYGNWIRDSQVADYLRNLLTPENSQYAQFIKTDYAKKYLQPHLDDERRNYASQILRAATLEIYLRKVVACESIEYSANDH